MALALPKIKINPYHIENTIFVVTALLLVLGIVGLIFQSHDTKTSKHILDLGIHSNVGNSPKVEKIQVKKL